MAIQFYLTDAGKAAVLHAENMGLSIALSHIGVGTAKYDPQTATSNIALVAEIERYPLNGGSVEPVSDQYAELLMALMVSVKFRCCLISLPNKNTGFFYHTHHQLSVNCGGKWNAIRLNSEESPYLSQSELNLLLLQNGGRNTAHYKKNVLGEFEHG